MADKEIADLTAATALSGSEIVHGVQSSNSRRITTRQIKQLGAELDEQTGTSYTFVAGDRGKFIEGNNASAQTFTVNNSVHTAGDEWFVCQKGAGQITIAAGAGVTLNAANGLKTASQYSVLCIKMITASVGVVFGDTTT